jgi:hypothetical protein
LNQAEVETISCLRLLYIARGLPRRVLHMPRNHLHVILYAAWANSDDADEADDELSSVPRFPPTAELDAQGAATGGVAAGAGPAAGDFIGPAAAEAEAAPRTSAAAAPRPDAGLVATAPAEVEVEAGLAAEAAGAAAAGSAQAAAAATAPPLLGLFQELADLACTGEAAPEQEAFSEQAAQAQQEAAERAAHRTVAALIADFSCGSPSYSGQAWQPLATQAPTQFTQGPLLTPLAAGLTLATAACESNAALDAPEQQPPPQAAPSSAPASAIDEAAGATAPGMVGSMAQQDGEIAAAAVEAVCEQDAGPAPAAGAGSVAAAHSGPAPSTLPCPRQAASGSLEGPAADASARASGGSSWGPAGSPLPGGPLPGDEEGGAAPRQQPKGMPAPVGSGRQLEAPTGLAEQEAGMEGSWEEEEEFADAGKPHAEPSCFWRV